MSETEFTKEQADGLLVACMSSGHTIRQQLQFATDYLQARQVDEARECAELLLLQLLKLSRAQLLMNWLEPFPDEQLNEWTKMLERKGQGEPLQYIIGEAWFYGRAFQVTPAVLIPRPETELLVEAVLLGASRYWEQEELTIVDVGTGSGAIALSLQLEQPNWHVIASDLSVDALVVAKQNATLHGVGQQIDWVQGDLLEPFSKGKESLSYNGREIDILVSNPPYIPQGDLPDLQREVQLYEPHLALFGGDDGLDPYRNILHTLQQLDKLPRMIALELGIYQPTIVADWLEKLASWTEISIITDYNGIDRHIVALRA